MTQKCYLNSIVLPYNLKVQFGKAYCKRTCYIVGNKKANEVTPAWNKDGKHGPNDTNHRMSILIAWLVTPGNLAKWRGSWENSGKTTTQIASHIAGHISP